MELTGYKVVIDPVRCDGHGICALFFAGGIALDEWGYPVVNRGPIGGDRRLRRAHRAVAACPEGAIRLEEVTDAGATRW